MMGILDVFGKFINNIFQFVYEVNAKLDFSGVTSYAVTIAIAFVGLCAIKQGLDIYVFQVDGDPDSDPVELFTRMMISISIIYCGDFILNELIKLSGVMSDEIQGRMESIASKKSFDEIFMDLAEKANGTEFFKSFMMGFTMTIICCITLIALIIFCFQAVKRGAELMLFQLILPLVATDLLTANKERWNAFRSELLLCVFGYIIQVVAYNVFLYLLAKGVYDPQGYSVIAALGWLIVVISTPKWLSKFVYSSGVGNGAKGGVRTAAFIVPQMVK